MRNLYADYKKAGADKIKKDANLRKEEELIYLGSLSLYPCLLLNDISGNSVSSNKST
jgi:hypothetical protein